MGFFFRRVYIFLDFMYLPANQNKVLGVKIYVKYIKIKFKAYS